MLPIHSKAAFAPALAYRRQDPLDRGRADQDLLHPWAVELLRTVYAICQARGYHLLLAHAEYSRDEGRELSGILHADRVDGVLLIGDVLGQADERQGREEMAGFVQLHRHVVSVGGQPSMAGELAVTVDYVLGTYLALEHLVNLGHRLIGYIGVRTGVEGWGDRQRRGAFRSFLDAHGLPREPAHELIVPGDIESVREALQAMVARQQRPTAIFANNDYLALVLLRAALTCGIRVPEDLSIAGFDDISFATLCTPSLTTVRYPIDEIAQAAAHALLDTIEGRTSGDGSGASRSGVVFGPTLIYRESSGPPSPTVLEEWPSAL